MFEIKCNVIRDISAGAAVRAEALASGKLLVKTTKGELLGITKPLDKNVIDSHYISHQRPLFGVVLETVADDCLIHMVAPGRIKPEFQKTKGADIIPFPVANRQEAA